MKFEKIIRVGGSTSGAIAMTYVFMLFTWLSKGGYAQVVDMNEYGEGLFESLIVWPMLWLALMNWYYQFKINEVEKREEG